MISVWVSDQAMQVMFFPLITKQESYNQLVVWRADIQKVTTHRFSKYDVIKE